jgi:hypothetical protein
MLFNRFPWFSVKFPITKEEREGNKKSAHHTQNTIDEKKYNQDSPFWVSAAFDINLQIDCLFNALFI